MKGQFCLLKIKLISVEPILFLYMLSIFMETMALQELFYVKSCNQLNHPVNISICNYALKHNNTKELNESASWFKRYNCCLFFFTFISSLYIGSWCDRFGRKFPMLIPPIGTACASIVNCLLSIFIDTHVAYFFISSVISGITFGSVGIIATTFGYISDFTHEQSRSKRIVILESMLFIGGTTGIYMSGLFLKDPHYDYVINEFAMLFMFEALVSIFIIIYISLVIPSHIPESQSLESNLSCAGYFNIKHVIESLKTVFRPREGGKRKKVLLMLLALFLVYFGGVVQTVLGYYFVKELGWKLPEYTLFHALQFILEGAALLIGLPTLLYFFNVPDYVFAMIGMLSRIAGFVVFGLSINNVMVYSCVALYIFSEFPIPALRSMLSKTVDADEKGRIFAFTAILQNLCYFLGSFILLTVFTEFTFKGLCFEIVAVLQGIALLIIIYLFLTRYEYVTTYTIIENEDGTVTEIKSVVASTDSVK